MLGRPRTIAAAAVPVSVKTAGASPLRRLQIAPSHSRVSALGELFILDLASTAGRVGHQSQKEGVAGDVLRRADGAPALEMELVRARQLQPAREAPGHVQADPEDARDEGGAPRAEDTRRRGHA